jgi:hypothetical protein
MFCLARTHIEQSGIIFRNIVLATVFPQYSWIAFTWDLPMPGLGWQKLLGGDDLNRVYLVNNASK